jgi:hypothetical protein
MKRVFMDQKSKKSGKTAVFVGNIFSSCQKILKNEELERRTKESVRQKDGSSAIICAEKGRFFLWITGFTGRRCMGQNHFLDTPIMNFYALSLKRGDRYDNRTNRFDYASCVVDFQPACGRSFFNFICPGKKLAQKGSFES